MKKLLWLLLLIPLMGCMTANQLAAEKSYYEAMVAMRTQQASQPIFEMTPAIKGEPIILSNIKSFKVFAPPMNSNEPLRQYVQKDYVQPWLNVLGAAVPWLGVWGVSSAIIGGMKDMGTTTNMNVNGTGNSGSIVGPTHNAVSGTGHYVGGTIDTTHPAQVVNPVIVDPVIVQPSYPPVP